MPVQVHYPDITKRAQKVLDLLSIHVVSTLGNERQFICLFANEANNNNVQVVTALKTEPPDHLGRG